MDNKQLEIFLNKKVAEANEILAEPMLGEALKDNHTCPRIKQNISEILDLLT